MIARITNGQIAEFRDLDISDIPPHKRSIWTPVVIQGDGDNSEVTIEADRVLITRSVGQSTPSTISDRQFFQQLAIDGIITADEALAAVGPGSIPPPMLAIVDSMPEAQRFEAKMLLSGATQFERLHPLVSAFATSVGWTQQQVDDFWRAASTL